MDNYDYEQEYMQRAIKDMVSYDVIVDDMHGLANDMHDLANDVHEAKQDLQGLKKLFAEYMALEQQR